MAKRKKVVSVYRSVGEVDQALLEMRRAKAEKARLEAKMNAEMATVAAKYEEAIEEQTEILAGREAQVKLFCEENRDTLFDKSKSLPLTHGTVSFRLGQVKTRTLPKWTFKKALEKAVELAKTVRKFKPYLKQAVELDRQKMVDDYKAGTITNADLEPIGVKCEQEETFAVNIEEAKGHSVPASAPENLRKVG